MNVVISAVAKKNHCRITEQLWVTRKLGGSHICITLNFQDVQVLAVKYGQNLATHQDEEHEGQKPKHTATWVRFLNIRLDVRRRNRRREDRRAESIRRLRRRLGIVSSREHSYACILADLQPYSRNLIGKN